MWRLAVAFSLVWLATQAASAGWTAAPDAAHDALVRVDWQYPRQLPPRFRNHCAHEYFTARPYCSDHCGGDYQFFYCSPASFGCCHFGRGYCDWSGLLRCHP
jgi:hypothetical protein